MGRATLLIGCWIGVLVLVAYAAGAAYGIVFIPNGGGSKYSPPNPWVVIQLDTYWIRALVSTAFSLAALALAAFVFRKPPRKSRRR